LTKITELAGVVEVVDKYPNSCVTSVTGRTVKH